MTTSTTPPPPSHLSELQLARAEALQKARSVLVARSALRLEPTVNDPGKWTVVAHLRTDNIDVQDQETPA